jgi:CBS domain-containing protein
MISIHELLEKKPRQIYSVHEGDKVSGALGLLAEMRIGAVLVMNGEKLVGILSERDCALRVTLPGKRADETPVADVMTRNVVTVDPKESLEDCLKQMNARDIRHLPVVEGDKVVGMVSIGDVSKELLREKLDLITYMESYVNRGFRL